MCDLICSTTQKARKPHTCDLCGEQINKGDLYISQKLKNDGNIYTWKEHYNCHFVCMKLSFFIAPIDGMTDEAFKEGCANYCEEFVCAHCEHWTDTEGCAGDKNYCIDKIIQRLKEHPLKIIYDEFNCRRWAE